MTNNNQKGKPTMKQIVKKTVRVCGKKRMLTLGLDVDISSSGEFTASGHCKFCGGEMAGQCLDHMRDLLAAHSLECQKLDAILKYWPRYHLNHLNPGSPRQMAVFHGREAQGLPVDYDTMCGILAAQGLLVDAEYQHNGRPYKYGEAWLKEELPAEVATDIKRIMAMPLEIKEPQA